MIFPGQKLGGQELVGGLDCTVHRNFFGSQVTIQNCDLFPWVDCVDTVYQDGKSASLNVASVFHAALACHICHYQIWGGVGEIRKWIEIMV